MRVSSTTKTGSAVIRLLKEFPVFKRIVMLRERHGTRIEPAVDHVGNTAHRLTAIRTGNEDLVDIRTVQFDIVSAPSLVACCLKLRQHFLIIRALLLQLGTAADAFTFASFTLPYRKRSAPVPVSAECPVLNIGDPFTKTSLADRFRDPVDGIVVADQIILYLAHGDIP